MRLGRRQTDSDPAKSTHFTNVHHSLSICSDCFGLALYLYTKRIYYYSSSVSRISYRIVTRKSKIRSCLTNRRVFNCRASWIITKNISTVLPFSSPLVRHHHLIDRFSRFVTISDRPTRGFNFIRRRRYLHDNSMTRRVIARYIYQSASIGQQTECTIYAF